MAQKLINLQSSSYEHPVDRAALKALDKALGVASVADLLNKPLLQWNIVQLCGSNFHVTKKSCPELYQLIQDAAETLDIDSMPEIYTQWSYGVNAGTLGYKNNTIIILCTGAVDLLPEPELTFVVGHELGHIKSNHVRYLTLGQNLSKLSMTVRGLYSAWNRKSEFTADRAGLLACQDLNAALSAIMKLAGIPKRYFNITDPQLFAEQAEEFMSQYGGTFDSLIKTLSIFDDNHPWTVMRAYELVKWVESGEYQKILDSTKGKYCPIHKGYVDESLDVCPIDGYRFEN